MPKGKSSKNLNGSAKVHGKPELEEGSRAVKKTKTEEKEVLYNWENVHRDLENQKYAGVHGGCNSVYFGLAGLRAEVDMEKYHTKRSEFEFIVPSLQKLVEKKETRECWDNIATIDPLGLTSKRPTMAACPACMTIPELESLERDGKIVNSDGTINIIKCAVDYTWNIPLLSKKLGMDEAKMRAALYRFTHIPEVKDPEIKTFLPPTGGATIYFIGDMDKISDPSTEIAVRVHDQCTGSDVFGTDICTCRPYLVFAIKGAVECAQRGGVGIIVYYQKEGRSLGEVTKFRVYNARKAQTGGDRAETYFYHTESIAGIRDARFQEMMPDVLRWLGIRRIDWLLSMSSEKYDAICASGIQVMQRVTLPDKFVPKNAFVEITAKIGAGYHTDEVKSEEILKYLRGLKAIRERTAKIYELAKENKTKYFKINFEKIDYVAEMLKEETLKNYPNLKVPLHSRWRHIPDQLLNNMMLKWKCIEKEKSRRMIDLVTVSVLLDAGAGDIWRYTDRNGATFSRSEGISIAVFDMFENGLFSSDIALKHRVNSYGLKFLKKESFLHSFQISNVNQLIGFEGRFKLMKRLAASLEAHPEFFGEEIPRPGNVVDYVLQHAVDGKVSIKVIWKAIIEGLEWIWPNTISGIRRGDCWVYNPLKVLGEPGSDLIPFHKLSQWLALSWIEPLERLGIQVTDINKFTALAEYRNGGLLIDSGLLELKDKSYNGHVFDVGSEVIVEWRALTVQLIDQVAERLRKLLGKSEDELTLPSILQGGTWSVGRKLAFERRKGGVPPLMLRSDGSVF